MQTLDTLFEREFRKVVAREAEALKESVCTGRMGHDEYKFHCGRLHGLTIDFDTLLSEVAEIISKR